MIVLNYVINGSKFKRRYADNELQQAIIRKQVLEENQIAVQLKTTKQSKEK